MATAKNRPILENEHVQELLALLKENDTTTRTALVSVLAHIGEMEEQYKAMTAELSTMREMLTEAQRQKHPARAAMQNAVIGAQSRVLGFRDMLAGLKQSIIDGCRAAADAVWDTGIAALNGVVQFLNIRPQLVALHKGHAESIQSAQRSIAKIEAVSREYHETRRHLKNIGRAMVGRATIQEAKPIGKIAGTFINSLQNKCAIHAQSQRRIGAMLGSLKRLEERAAGRVSFKETLEAYRKQRAEEPAPAAPTRTQPATEAR